MDTFFLLLLSSHFYPCYSFAFYEATFHANLRQIFQNERSIISKTHTECYDTDDIVGFSLFLFYVVLVLISALCTVQLLLWTNTHSQAFTIISARITLKYI